MIPTTRESFKDYCLRKLGQGAIDIDVTDAQWDDRVDEALSFWYDYSIDGTEKLYYKYQVQEGDSANGYITLPENIIGAVRIFRLGQFNSNISNPFNINYQIALNDLYNLSSISLVPYYAMNLQLANIEEWLIGEKPIRYNRVNNQLHVDMDWEATPPGSFIVVEAYGVIDPDTWVKTFKDRTLQNYATALMKMNWASNLSKFQEMTLPGGIKMNGQQLYEQANAEVEKWEQFIMSCNPPQAIFLG